MFKKTLLLAIVLSIVIVMTLNHLAIAGTITGTVIKESDGTPIAGLWVDAQDYDTGEYRVGASTNSSGFYVISGLTGGTYRVKVSTWNTDFVEEYYDNVLDYDHATPVVIPAIGVVQNINFRLALGGTITGIVTDSNSAPISNLWVEACDYGTNQYRSGGETNSDGFYIIPRLAAGTYCIRVSTRNTDFIPEYYDNVLDYDNATPVVVPAAGLVQNINFSLEVGGLTVSGKVTDKATGSALADIMVTYWNDDFEIWTYDYTDTDGTYKLTGLLPGWVEIRVEPESYYAWIGTEFNLTQDIDNLDFALSAGAILSGKVIDAETAQPLADIEVTYGNYRYAVWQNDFTDGDGTFTLTNLPPGIAEVKASPDVDSGYAWNLPWGGDEIYLNDGEDKSNRIIALHKGALVSGYIKDPNGNPLSNFEYDYEGRLCEGWSETDITGRYEIRLPVGIYSIGSDEEDDFGALPKEVTITDINQPVNVPDMIVYSEQSGGQISGSVNNPGGYLKTGNFIIVAFEIGTVIDPNTWYTIQPISETDLQQAGPFTITSLPQGVNYDVHLLVMSNTPDEIESCALRDSVLNVPVGTTGINLNYTSQGSTVTGKVTNTRGNPVLGATVLLTVSSTGNFAGFADTDPNGDYIIYNVPAGTYTATAVHSKYLNTSKTVQVVNGVPADVSTIVMPFAGEKDGADLNGDGLVNMFDFTELANQWLRPGSLEADFTKDNLVDFADLTRIAENWLWQAIWR